MYDLIIFGAGPAGMTAAIYAARRKINFIILSSNVGGQMTLSSEVKNYPGYSVLTGTDLTAKFQEHVSEYGVEIKQEEILNLEKRDSTCFVKTSIGKYESKAVIIATGKKSRKLDVPGEENFAGKGVSYCATCDAPLFKDKVVAVIGGGNSGLEAALFLSKYANKIYLLETSSGLKGEKYLRDPVLNDNKISVILNSNVKEIYGEKVVKGLKYLEKDKEKSIDLDGIFVEVGLITEADFTNVKKNKWGEIIIKRRTNTHDENLTSVPGIFAAGDCTDIPAKQIVAAAGEGCKAALASFDYILK